MYLLQYGKHLRRFREMDVADKLIKGTTSCATQISVSFKFQVRCFLFFIKIHYLSKLIIY